MSSRTTELKAYGAKGDIPKRLLKETIEAVDDAVDALDSSSVYVAAIFPSMDGADGFLLNTDTFTEGQVVYAGGHRLKKANDGATDHHIVNSASTPQKFYIDEEIISTSVLGWVADEDISTKLSSFLASRLTGVRALQFDAKYRLQGVGYTIPDGLNFISADYEVLSHGEFAQFGFDMMDANPQTAAVFGLTFLSGRVFNCPDRFLAVGLHIGDASAVDTSLLVSGGPKEAVFKCVDKDTGPTILKCNFSQSGGDCISVENSPNWKVSQCNFGKQKAGIRVIGTSHHGEYSHNRGEMGFVGRNVSDTGPQSYGDFIKTARGSTTVGPRYCNIMNNQFINKERDGPDGTGGFHGWKFTENVFDVSIAGIDIKQFFNAPGDVPNAESSYRGIIISNNIFIGCGIVYTATWNEAGVGYAYDEDLQIKQTSCIGNVYIAQVGGAEVAHFFKSGGHMTSIGEHVISTETVSAGNWDASTGTFPSGAVAGTHYIVSVAGTVDGESFSVGHYLRPIADDASTTTYEGQWVKTASQSSFVGMKPLAVGDTGGAAGIFPSYIDISDMNWDGRGASASDLTRCRKVKMNFAEMLTEGLVQVQIGGEYIEISGKIRSTERPGGGASDILNLKDGANEIDINVQYEHESSNTRGALVRVTGAVTNIYINGRAKGCFEVVDNSNTGDITNLRFGAGGHFIAESGISRILTNDGATDGIWFGSVETRGNTLYNNEPTNHNMAAS